MRNVLQIGWNGRHLNKPLVCTSFLVDFEAQTKLWTRYCATIRVFTLVTRRQKACRARQIIDPDRSQIFDVGVNLLSLRHQCENPYSVRIGPRGVPSLLRTNSV